MTASSFARSSRLSLSPLVCLGLSGSSLTEHEDIPPGGASFGKPVWGPPALLANLELRLGLATPRVAEVVRLQHWARRLDEALTTSSRFYARSYAADRLGTATALLAMRDELVTAGWNGETITDGGERLDTFAALERGLALPSGDADRLRVVEAELGSTRLRPFDALLLTEPLPAWPGRWQRIFALLSDRGVCVEHARTPFDPVEGDGELARVQAALRGEPRGRGPLRGDGSFVLLRGETSWELAHAVASLLDAWGGPSVVVRGGDVPALDGALRARGLGSQGVDSPSAWRPMLQVLRWRSSSPSSRATPIA